MKSIVWLFFPALLGAPGGETLRVGPGQPLARIEDAVAKAKPGDVIEVYPAAGRNGHDKVAVYVTQKSLTIRAVPAKKGERVKLSGDGFSYSGEGRVPRAIFQFNAGADGCVLEGFELAGAHNDSHNGAGVRINQANHVTVRDCDIHENDMGIMSNGDGSGEAAVDQLIEQCHLHHNGSEKEPGYNHNLYLGGGSVVLRFCEVDHSLTGQNVKSRAHYTRVEYSFIHDSANREFDFVDEKDTALANSHAVLLGNVIVKAKDMQGNKGVIHFGQDGGKEHDGTIYLVHNTIVTPYISAVVELSAPKAKAHFAGNILWNGGAKPGPQEIASARNGADVSNVTGTNNWLSDGFSIKGTKVDASRTAFGPQPGFADPAKADYHLAAPAPGILDGGPKDLKIPPTPGAAAAEPDLAWQYKHPCGREKRPSDKKPDLGAYEKK